MQDFIKNVVQECIKNNTSLLDVTFILPGKRPIVFIKKAFKEENYNGVLPEFITIEDWKIEIAEVSPISGIQLWLESYLIYQSIENESFDEFIKWIPTTLKDFDEIDIFSENPHEVINYLISAERIENWDLIATDLMKSSLLFWEKLKHLYIKLHADLRNKKLATQGQINRIAIERIENYIQKNDHKKLIFIGFNAFNPKEEKIISLLDKKMKLEFYWHADSYYVNDTNQEAGFFLREHFKKSIYTKNGKNWIENQFNTKKNITTVSCTKQISQAKYMGNLLENIPENEWNSTAIVLCDEILLGAVIESIPENITKVNITMGFPLKSLPQAILFERIFYFKIQNEKRKTPNFYFREVLEILNEIVPNSISEEYSINKIKQKISENSKIYFTEEFISKEIENTTFQFVFQNQNSVEFNNSLRNYCIDCYTNKNQNILNKESYIRFSEIFTQLEFQLKNINFELNYESLHKLFIQILKIESIDFVGEPIAGIQIMGVLETRLLNFKNLIMLSVNEGKLPLGRSENSFIPFDIKKKFNINTFAENDAIYSYHFYRLLQNAENIHLIYNNYSESVNSGEKSRFITQIEIESNQRIENEIISTQNISNENAEIQLIELIEIEKTETVQEKLQQWIQKGLSPTHLTSYLYNPIAFYFSKILQIKQNEEIEENVSAMNYGNIVHECLHQMYLPLIGIEMKDSNLLENQLNNKDTYLDKAIEKIARLELFENGYNYLQKKIMLKTIENVVNFDINLLKQKNILQITSLEEYIENVIEIEGMKPIKILGYIDRIDKLNDTIRVIDYKSAKSNNLSINDKNFDENFAGNSEYNQSLQLTLYAYMLLNNGKYNEVECGIWSLKYASQGVKSLNFNKKQNLDLVSISEPMEKIKNLILEILNSEIPFIEREKEEFSY